MKDFSEFRQFVPSRVCLSCDGCCRFRDEKSEWRPRVAMEEKAPAFFLTDDNPIYSRKNVDPDNYLKAFPCRGSNLCGFLQADNYCVIYDRRPFECRLYPFLITRDEKGVSLSAHLGCPYLQETCGTEVFNEYAAYLREFFPSGQTALFLKRNIDIIGEYREFKEEMMPLFTISLDADDPVWDEKLLGLKEDLSAFLKNSSFRLSSFHFSQIALWQEHFRFFPQEIKGNLCIFATNHLGMFLYLPPLGAGSDPQTVERCFAVMDEVNHGSGVSRIENVPLEQLKYFDPEKYAFYEKGREYCYVREEIACLRGEKYKSRRSDLNYFLKNNSYEYAPYAMREREECLQLLNEWTDLRLSKELEEISREMLSESKRVQRLALQYHRELGLIGRVVKVDGRVRGYTFGYPITERDFCVLFEIADLTIKGLAVFIFNQFVNDPQLRAFEFINVMDDCCPENVNKTKMSFRPKHMLPIYIVTKKG